MGQHAYSQTGDYIPRKDAAFLDWCNSFNTSVQANGAALGLTPDDQDRIALWTGRWRVAYRAATTSDSRTACTVRAKKNMRREVEAIMRDYAQQMKHTAGVPEDLLMGAGLHVDDLSRTRINRPVTSPMLGVRIHGLQHVLTYADQTTPNRKRKPHGVRTIQLYGYKGESWTDDYTRASELGEWGRQPIRFDYLPEDAGLTMTYFGRWVTSTGLKGPWSLPVYLTIAAGSGSHSKQDTLPLPFPEQATSKQQRRAA